MLELKACDTTIQPETKYVLKRFEWVINYQEVEHDDILICQCNYVVVSTHSNTNLSVTVKRAVANVTEVLINALMALGGQADSPKS